MAPELIESTSQTSEVQIQTTGLSSKPEGMYSRLSKHPVRNERIHSMIALIPDTFSLDLHNKITQNVKPSSLVNYN